MAGTPPPTLLSLCSPLSSLGTGGILLFLFSQPGVPDTGVDWSRSCLNGDTLALEMADAPTDIGSEDNQYHRGYTCD